MRYEELQTALTDAMRHHERIKADAERELNRIAAMKAELAKAVYANAITSSDDLALVKVLAEPIGAAV